MPFTDRPPRSLPLVSGILGLVTLALMVLLLVGEQVGVGSIARGLALAMLPVPLYLGVALWVDRYEPEPPWMLGAAFGWGATVAVLISLLLTGTSEALALAVLSRPSAEFVALVVTAPLVEEVAKAMVLVLLFLWKPREFDNVTDGIVYASMVGLGFAMTENVLYYGAAAAEGGEVGTVLVLRGVLSPFAHPFFTSMVGIGLGLVRQAEAGHRLGAAPFVGLAVAVSLHTLWNLAAMSGRFFGVYLFVMVPLFAGVLLLLCASLRREVEIVRHHLAPELEAGRLCHEELALLCDAGRRFRATVGAWRSGGRAGWAASRSYHHALTELAFHRWRVARGHSAGEEPDARREAMVLARVAELRASLPAGRRPLARSQ
jgi:protease PrsW